MNWLPMLGLAFGLAAPAPKEDAKKVEPATIVGKWECVEIVGGGQQFPAEEAKHVAFEFTVDGKFSGRFGQQIPEGTYSTDAKKDPAEIDYTSGKIAKMNMGIYKVEKDTLTFCFAEGGGERPTKFESPAGTRIVLLTFKRVEKKKE